MKAGMSLCLGRVALAALMAAVLFACSPGSSGSGEDSPVPVAASSPASEASTPAGWQECESPALGFALSYPEGWYTTDTVVLPNGGQATKARMACRFLNPEPFEIWWGTEPPTTALMAETRDKSASATADELSDPRYLRTVGRSETSAGEMPAIELEVEQYKEGYYPKGTQEYMVIVQTSPASSVVVSTMTFPGSDVDYDAYKEIVDQAAQTVRPL